MPHFKDRDKELRTSVKMLPSTIWIFSYTTFIVLIFTGCPSGFANTVDRSRNSGMSSLDPNSEPNIERLLDVKFSPTEELGENQRRKSDGVPHRDVLILLEGSMDGSKQPTAQSRAPATSRRRRFSAAAQTLPRTCQDQVCYRMSIDAMSWERAQEHCRSLGGFLADETQTRRLHKAPRNWNDHIIWTGLTKYRNHFQWLTEYAEYSIPTPGWWDPAPPGLAPGPWLEGCPAYNVSSNTFHLISCSYPLHFACFDASQKEEERISDGVELRISYRYNKIPFRPFDNVTSQNLWLSLGKDEFKSLQLTCNFYNKSSGEKLDKKNTVVHWTKDDIFLPHRSPKIRVTGVADALKLRLLQANTPSNDEFILNQGSFQCESWLPNTNKRLASSTLLVTLNSLKTCVVSAAVIEPSDHSPDDKALIVTLGRVFRDELPNWNGILKGLINIQREQLNNGSWITTYNLHVYLPATLVNSSTFSDLNKKLQEAYTRNSYVKSPFHCSEEREDIGFGNVVKWPSSDPGPISSEKVQCRAKNGLSIHGTCHWDFSKGAYVEKPSTEKCDSVGLCPRGYSTVSNVYCVAISSAGSWETGFSQSYKTSKESNLLDILKSSVQNTIFFRDFLLKETNKSTSWLPIRRMTKHSPLIHIGFTSSNFTLGIPGIEFSFNVSWTPGHPLITKDCLALDLIPLQLSSRDCNESLPFMSIVDLSVLEEALKSSLSANSSGLTERSDSECTQIEGFSPGYSTDTRTCITVKQIGPSSSWRKAYEQCEGDLPQPGKGFMSWIYEKLLIDYQIRDVYMAIGKEKDAVPANDSQVEYYNWIPGINIENSFGVIQRDGWTLINDSLPNAKDQFCEKTLKMNTDSTITLEINYYTRNIDVFFSLHFPAFERNSLRCFLNGIIVAPSFLSGGKVEVNLEANHFGYCVCFIWKRNPVMWIKSNELFIPQSSFVIYFIKLLHIHETYQPSIHDSTFFSNRSRTHCQNVLFNELEKYVTTENISASVILYSPEKLNGGISELISVQIPYASNVTDGVDDALANIFPDDILPLSILDSNCSLIQIRKTGGCRKVVFTESPDKRNVTFNSTVGFGTFGSDELCDSQTGVTVTRHCYGDDIEGFYWSPPITGECSTVSSANKTRQRKILLNPSFESDGDSNVTTNSSGLSPIHILSTVDTLRKIIQDNNVNQEPTDTTEFRHLVSIVDSALAANQSQLESLVSTFNFTNNFLTSFETLAFTLPMDPNPGDSFKGESRTFISTKRVEVTSDTLLVGYSATQWDDVDEAQIVEQSQINDTRYGVQAEIIFPQNLIHSLIAANKNESTVVRVLFSVMHSDKLFLRRESDTLIVNSPIIQVTIHGYPVRDLNESDPIRLTFEPFIEDNATVCGFWNVTENNELGGWSIEGCWKGEGNGSLVNCFCNHLTSFALLINSDSVDIGEDHILILNIITLIGCCMSIFGLLMVFLTFGLFKAWRKSNSNKILVNFSIAVFCSMVLFLGGIDQTDNTILCRSVAASLHYFILSSFCWMVVEAFQQYLLFGKVVGSYIPRFMWKVSAFAWGLPLVPVVTLLIIDSSLYESRGEFDKRTKICWISAKAFNYAFLPPLVMTMIINLFFYIFIICKVCQKSKMRCNLNERDLMIKKLNMAVCVFFLLGFTWLFGVLMIIEGTETIFAYLFSIFNSLQGFSIFIFFVWREKSARGKWSDLFAVLKSNNDDDSQVCSLNRLRVPENVECAAARRLERTRLVSENTYSMTQSTSA